MPLRIPRPRRRWWFHVAWVTPNLGAGYRLYTETFPWFTARDRIAKAAWEFVREEVGGDEFALLTLDFKPNRGREPVQPYNAASSGQKSPEGVVRPPLVTVQQETPPPPTAPREDRP